MHGVCVSSLSDLDGRQDLLQDASVLVLPPAESGRGRGDYRQDHCCVRYDELHLLFFFCAKPIAMSRAFYTPLSLLWVSRVTRESDVGGVSLDFNANFLGWNVRCGERDQRESIGRVIDRQIF